MPNATVRAADKGLPKSAPKRDPSPTAAELRQHAADLRSAVALLEAAEVVERELAEPKEAHSSGEAPNISGPSKAAAGKSALEDAIGDVHVWLL